MSAVRRFAAGFAYPRRAALAASMTNSAAPTRRNALIGVLMALAIALLGGTAVSPASSAAAAGTTATSRTNAAHRMFAYYYLWWSTRHWHDKLGSDYPYDASPLPLPATLDSSGCNATSRFAGNHLLDAPRALWTQDRAATMERDVRSAVRAGLAGFAVNWNGTGSRTQTPRSTSYNRRLAALVRVVDRVRREGKRFSLWVSYKGSARVLPARHIVNDLSYLARTYRGNPAFDRSNGHRPTVILTGSRKYGTSALATISRSARRHFYLVGDENWDTWTRARARHLDGDQYYWSSQDPYRNPHSFDQLAELAAKVRHSGRNPDGTRKRWFAPLAPGFNTELAGGSTCVPRKGGRTLKALYAGNSRTRPDGWVVISWNEITENTYLVPMQRYGRESTATLRSIVDSA
jgi:hypothetical protein